ncbi:hypothetical protein [Paraburkholderia steynii]|uniref:hypothetical protein n=1 Tax=Paraburkholderia steynii TaxID=1245441 RepID=UPI001423DE6B|nr:hypothetical protein [Paraburkholderia steynii]
MKLDNKSRMPAQTQANQTKPNQTARTGLKRECQRNGIKTLPSKYIKPLQNKPNPNTSLKRTKN